MTAIGSTDSSSERRAAQSSQQADRVKADKVKDARVSARAEKTAEEADKKEEKADEKKALAEA